MSAGGWIAGGLGVGALAGVALLVMRRDQTGEISEVTVTQTKVPAANEPNYFLPTNRKGAAPKSVRNNNPTNLRYISSAPFTGQTKNDAGYGVYSTALLGARAGFRNLQNYFTRDGLDTVRGIVSKWAPTSENPTSAYITFVAQQLSVSPDQALTYQTHARSLIKAMARFEAGYQPFNDQLYADAYKAAA